MSAHSRGLGSGLINPPGSVEIPLLGEFPANITSQETDTSYLTVRSGISILPIKPKQRITLHKAREGYHTSGKWYENQKLKEQEICEEDKKIKDAIKKAMKQDSFQKVFPTFNMDLSDLPKEQKLTDRSLRYAQSGPNAFKTHAQKYKNFDRSYYSSQKPWFPSQHPEYVPVDKTYNYQKNYETEFIEAMTKIKNLGFGTGSQRNKK